MSEKNEGGQAFPCLDMTTAGLSLRAPGMTMRDYFAAKAMQGEIAASAGGQRPGDLAELAGFSYAMADAMLAQREETT
jgi:hypothetical protein